MVKTNTYSIWKNYNYQNFNHIKFESSVLAIPGPDENMISQLTSKMYSFIWDDSFDHLFIVFSISLSLGL
jgi:hypothetical protein